MRGPRTARALCDAPYAFALGDHVDPFDEVRHELPGVLRVAAARSRVARAFAVAWLGRRRALVIADWGVPATGLPVLTRLLCGRRRLVLLNFHLPVPRDRGGPGFAIRRRLLRGAVRSVQVLAASDAAEVRRGFGWDGDEVAVVPYPWRRRADSVAVRPAPAGRRVLASGRAYCDWPTLLRAAAGAGWELTVVAPAGDLAPVRALAASAGADLRSEVTPEEHDALLAACDVYVVPLVERHISAGHVRLRDANERGVPVVVAAIDAVREYVDPGRSAETYPPGDAAGLRAAVDRLLADPSRAAGVARAAGERSARWDQHLAFVAQRAYVERLLGLRDPSDPTPLAPEEVSALLAADARTAADGRRRRSPAGAPTDAAP